MKFDQSKFAKAMDDKWNKKDDQAMEYKDDGSEYRTWRQDSSACYLNGGMVVSTKIDHIRGGNKDDHIIVILAYDMNGKLALGSASIQMKKEDPIMVKPITEGDIAQGVKNGIKKQLKSDYGWSGSDDGRQNIPNVVKMNIDAMTKSVVV